MRKTYRCMKITHLYNRKLFPRCSLNVIFCCIWNQKNQNKQKYLEKIPKSFWKLIDKSWTQCYSMYRKTENEIKIWLFFTWFYSLKLFISVGLRLWSNRPMLSQRLNVLNTAAFSGMHTSSYRMLKRRACGERYISERTSAVR